jgi:hypothetical protein
MQIVVSPSASKVWPRVVTVRLQGRRQGHPHRAQRCGWLARRCTRALVARCAASVELVRGSRDNAAAPTQPKSRCFSPDAAHRRRPQPTGFPPQYRFIAPPFLNAVEADLPDGRLGRRGSGRTARLGLAGRFTGRGRACSSPTTAKLLQQEGMAAPCLLLRRRRSTGHHLLESACPLSRTVASDGPDLCLVSESKNHLSFDLLTNLLGPFRFSFDFSQAMILFRWCQSSGGGALPGCYRGVAGVHPIRPAASWRPLPLPRCSVRCSDGPELRLVSKVSTFSRLPSPRICLAQILIRFFAGHDPLPVVCPGCGGVIRCCCCGAVAGVHRSPKLAQSTTTLLHHGSPHLLKVTSQSKPISPDCSMYLRVD